MKWNLPLLVLATIVAGGATWLALTQQSSTVQPPTKPLEQYQVIPVGAWAEIISYQPPSGGATATLQLTYYAYVVDRMVKNAVPRVWFCNARVQPPNPSYSVPFSLIAECNLTPIGNIFYQPNADGATSNIIALTGFPSLSIPGPLWQGGQIMTDQQTQLYHEPALWIIDQNNGNLYLCSRAFDPQQLGNNFCSSHFPYNQ